MVMAVTVEHEYRQASNGYMVRRGRFGQYHYQHRDVWESVHGPIPEGYHIHHKNKNRADNRIENMECIEGAEHLKMHGMSPEMTGHLSRIRPCPERMVDCWSCDRHFTSRHRLQKFCSKACTVKYNNWLNDAKKSARRAARMKALVKTVECPVCKKAFQQKDYREKYCTERCLRVAVGRRWSARVGHKPTPSMYHHKLP